MRLVHFADLHLGIETYGSYDTRRGMSTRVVDFLRSFDSIVDFAIENKVDAVLFAGDAFKNRDPSPTLQREFARRIVRLSQAGIPIVLLVGNHDVPATHSRATHTEVYQVLETPGVYVCRAIDLLRIETRSGPLQVVSIPWVTRSTFLADEAFRIKADSDLDVAMGEAIRDAVQDLLPHIDRSHPAVLLGHLSLQGASFGFERSIMLGKDLTVGFDDINASAFDYVALGHIHKHQQVGARPPVVYAGSPERVDFGEEREAKGFVDLRIEEGTAGDRDVSWTFVELDTRPFLTLRIDASGAMPMEVVTQRIASATADLAGSVVRCFVQVDAGLETSVSPLEIRRMLTGSGAAHVARVVIESETRVRPRIEMRPGDEFDSGAMLERWVAQKEYDSAFAERLLTRGRELIGQRRLGSDGEGTDHG